MDMIEKVLIYAIAATIGATLAVCIIVTFMECK